MLEPVRPVAVSPDKALYLPTFSHFVIVNKTSLALSLSPPFFLIGVPEQLKRIDGLSTQLKQKTKLELN